MSEQRKEVIIEKKKLLLAEGKDAQYFLVWACRKYGKHNDIQVIDFGGIKELGTFLMTLSNVEGFKEVETLVIARDSESDKQAALTSIQTALRAANLPTPRDIFKYESSNSFKTAIMIFPGPEFNKGTLEDLCLEIVKDDPVMSCVDDYLECLKRKQSLSKLTVPHKRKLHTFLSGKDKDFVGATIGQASYRNAWNSEHSALKPFRNIIETM